MLYAYTLLASFILPHENLYFINNHLHCIPHTVYAVFFGQGLAEEYRPENEDFRSISVLILSSFSYELVVWLLFFRV